MPLTAILGGTRISAPLLTGDAWASIYDARPARGEILCPACKDAMYAKLRIAGREVGDPLRFFAHYPDGQERHCEFAAETVAHLELKQTIAAAASNVGATVNMEVPFDGGRVDVLAQLKSGETWALEAQLSPLNTQDAVERNRRYQSEYGSVCWLHTKTRPWRRQVPALEVAGPNDHIIVGGVFADMNGEISCPPHPVSDAVAHILEHEYQWIYDESRYEGRGFGWWVNRPRNVAKARSIVNNKAKEERRRRGGRGGADICARTGDHLDDGSLATSTVGPCRWCGGPAALKDRDGWLHIECEKKGMLRTLPLGSRTWDVEPPIKERRPLGPPRRPKKTVPLPRVCRGCNRATVFSDDKGPICKRCAEDSQ